jgi:hypothetical protein
VDPDAVCAVKLVRYPVGVMSGDPSGVPLLTLDWSAAADLAALRSSLHAFPRRIVRSANLGPFFGRQSWQDARVLELNDDLRDDAAQFIMTVIDLLEGNVLDPILERSAARYREVAAAYALSAQERAAIFRNGIAKLSGMPSWIFETPQTEDDFSFRLCAGGRLLECIGPDWKPIVRAVMTEEGRFMFPMLLGRTNGDDLQILR